VTIRNAISLISLFCATLFLLSCSDSSGGSGRNNSNQLIPAVEAVQARYGSLPLVERLSGVVKAKNQVDIYPQIAATITEIYVNNGDDVAEGTPLLALRDKEFRERLKQGRAAYQITMAQKQQAEAALTKLRAELGRMEALAEKGLASAAELEEIQSEALSAEADVELARARVEQAQATVEEREEALSQTIIRAPVSGTVGNRNAEIGMLVSSGTRLFTIGQLDNVRVEVILTDRMLNYIEIGQTSKIYSENLPHGLVTANLSRISPFLHPVTHSTMAEIDMANPNGALKSGMFVTVDIHYGESEQAPLVPLSALYENPGSGATGLYVSHDSLRYEPVGSNADQDMVLTDPVSFKFVPIEVLAKGRMEAGVYGVDPGSWVVTIGQDLLGTDSGTARVRPVSWNRVEELQNLQSEDLLQEVMKRQQAIMRDSAPDKPQNPRSD
jgi:HlyD family secretion protein